MNPRAHLNRILKLSLSRIRAILRRVAGLWSRESGNGWQAQLAAAAGRLQELNRVTERDFLAVGERLIHFRSVARTISAEIGSLHAMLSGEQARHTVEALSGVLEAFRGTDSRIEESGRALAGVGGLSRRIQLAFTDLHQTVPVFRALCTLTRMETARLAGGGKGLSNLAEEVAPLSERIQASAESVFEASSRLNAGVQVAVQNVSEIWGRQLREVPAMIAKVTSSIGSLSERQREAHEVSRREAAGNCEIGQAIDHLVASIQFHDITRQQIDHVAQALSELCSTLPSQRGNQAPPDLRAVLALQASQLASAEGSFTSAMRQIGQDIEHIRSRVMEVADDCRSLVGLENDQQSFFGQMETMLGAVLDGIASCGAAEKELERAAAGLEETIREMRQAVVQVCGIEIQIQRIATNAAIRAAHLGAVGSALDVIAGGIGRLALDSNHNTEDASAALDLMREVARQISAGEGLAGRGRAEQLRRAVLEFHSSTETSAARVFHIAELSSRLAEDIGTMLGGFSAGRMLAETVDGVRAEMAQIGTEASDAPSEDAPVALVDYSHRYTMQSEREIHQRLTAGGATNKAESEPAAPQALAEADALGDNVELF